MNSGAGITTAAPTQCSSCPPPNPFSRRSRRLREPRSRLPNPFTRIRVNRTHDQAIQEREARGSANAQGASGVSSPGDETFAAPEPAIHGDRMRSQGSSLKSMGEGLGPTRYERRRRQPNRPTFTAGRSPPPRFFRRAVACPPCHHPCPPLATRPDRHSDRRPQTPVAAGRSGP